MSNSSNKPQMRWLPKQNQMQQDPQNQQTSPNKLAPASSNINNNNNNNSNEKKEGNFMLYSVPPPPDASAAFTTGPTPHQNFMPFVLPNPSGVPLSQHQNLDQIKDQIFSLLTSSPNKQQEENGENYSQRPIHSIPPPFSFGSPIPPFMQFNNNVNMHHPGVIGHIPYQQPFPAPNMNHFPPFSYPYQYNNPPMPNQNNFPTPNFANFNFQNINPSFLQTMISPDATTPESAEEALLNDLKKGMGNIILEKAEENIEENPIIDHTQEHSEKNKNNNNIISKQISPKDNVISDNVPGNSNSPLNEAIDEKKKIGLPLDYTLNGIYHTVHSRKLLEKYAAQCEKNYAKITKTIDNLFEEVRPPKEDMAKRKELLKRVQSIIADNWPNDNAKLHLFGSSANEFCLKGGDIDMCLTINKTDDQKVEVVEDLGRLLVKNQFDNVVSLSSARVPIVKFKDPKSGYSCDICINNILALENTKLLAYYAKIDPRLKKLACVIKYWAKRRQINAPFAGTLSSYAYVLLIIHFLQRRDPPILPCLQIGVENLPKIEVEGYDCTYHTNNLNNYKLNASKNKHGVGKLLVDFYKFYGLEFDYVNCVISVRTGGFFLKESKDWKRPKHNRESCFLGLEDPFEVTHNLGRVVDKRGIEIIRNELERAFIILARKGDFLRVLKEYKEDDQDCNWR